jgi:dTDP-4-dehydrorhamnose reductase
MSPTYSRDGAQAGNTPSAKSFRLFMANAGSCTWYEFACKALEIVGMGNRIEPISFSTYPMKARRPKDSSLESTKLDLSLKECLRPWPEAVKAYVTEKGHLSSEN